MSPLSAACSLDVRKAFQLQLQEIKPRDQLKLQDIISLINQPSTPLTFTSYAIRELLKKNLIDNKPLEACYYLSLMLRDTAALVDAIWHYFIHFTSVQSDYDQVLWLGAHLGKEPLVTTAIAHGASVNAKFSQTNTPLIQACKKGHGTIVSILLKNGADAQVISGGHHHHTPLSEAKFHKIAMREHYLELKEKDQGLTTYFFINKTLGHYFSLQATFPFKGKSYYMEGFRTKYILKDYLKLGKRFYEELKGQITDGNVDFSPQSPIERQQLCNAIDLTVASLHDCFENRYTPETAIRRIEEGLPLVLFDVTRNDKQEFEKTSKLHAWGFVIIKSHEADSYAVHMCNRTKIFSSHYGSAQYFLNKKQTYELITTYLRATQWKTDINHHYEKKLASLVQAMENSSKPILIKQTEQKTRNCCFYSFQAIELALMTICLTLFVPHPTGDLNRKIKSLRTERLKALSLERYLYTHLNETLAPYPIDWYLILKIYHNHPFRSVICRFMAHVWHNQTELSPAISSKINWLACYTILILEKQNPPLSSLPPFRDCDVDILFIMAHNMEFNDTVINYLISLDHDGAFTQQLVKHYLLWDSSKFIAHQAKNLVTQRKIDPNITINEEGDTMLMKCMETMDISTARALLEAGVHVNAMNYRGETPLSYLIRIKEDDGPTEPLIALVKVLLDYGANKEAVDHLGFMPWIYGLKYQFKDNQFELLDLLIPEPFREEYCLLESYQNTCSILLQAEAHPVLNYVSTIKSPLL